MQVTRRVSLTPPEQLTKILGGDIPETVRAVAYTTENTVRNTGDKPWTRETGAPSIWLLGMFNPTPQTTIHLTGSRGALDAIAKRRLGAGLDTIEKALP
jgi:hypothetical protein